MTKELENMLGTAQIEESLNYVPQLVYREELPIMSEEELQEAKSFKRECEIDSLRRKIRQDMMDYKLLHTDQNIGVDGAVCYLFRSGSDPYFHGVRNFFALYLEKQIDKNLMELKKLIEEVNTNA